jgi:hypothetical protein
VFGRRATLLWCVLLAAASTAPAQQALPRIAVIPLNPVGVAKADAAAFTGLLEVALVKTGVFDVLEQGQVDAILEAQERSVADCTDEKCAIEFGRLLAAEQILLGSISTTGGKYFLAAKIIDVTTGRTARADTVDAGSITDLTGEVELLASKLAGLTFSTGGRVEVARAFAELFVETVPDGAEVLLNGVVKGRSPLLVERVPVGRVTIVARRDTWYATRDVDVTADSLTKLKLELAVSLGNLFVRSPVREGMRVLLDGADLGELGAGLEEGLPVGEHQLVLRGGGYYWEGRITVQTGKTVSVEAFPREVGSVEYAIPEGAQAELTAKDARTVLVGSGRLENVYAQTYSLRVRSADYEPLDAAVTVGRGQTVRVAPAMRLTEAGRRAGLRAELSARLDAVAGLAAEGRVVSASDVWEAETTQRRVLDAEFRFDELADRAEALRVELIERLAGQKAQAARADYERRLGVYQSAIASGGREAVTEAEVETAERLSAEIAASADSTEELRARARQVARDLRIRSLEDRRGALEAQLARLNRSRRGLAGAGWAGVGLGAAAGGLAGVAYALGAGAYGDYLAAGDAAATAAAWRRVSSFAAMFRLGIVGGCVGLGVGPVLLIAAPRVGALTREIEAVDRDLGTLRGEGR